MPFYTDILGFRLSDYILRPFKAYFFHLNPRHHSLAFVDTGTDGVHHLMVELCYLDDVGQAYDLALRDPARIGATFGRHTNDEMTSFYSISPSKFMVEYGWGGRSIDPDAWIAAGADRMARACGVMTACGCRRKNAKRRAPCASRSPGPAAACRST